MDPLHAIASSAVAPLLKDGQLSESKLRFAWRLAVGPAIDRVSRVALGPGESVIVTVDDPRWRKEVARSQATILERLKALLGPNSLRRITVT